MGKKERKTRETKGWSGFQQVEIPFFPLCLNSWSQSGLDLFFSRFSPATCALTYLAETTPPVWNSTASAFHKNFPQFGFQVCVMKLFFSICLWNALSNVYDPALLQPIKLMFDFLKHIFFHHRNYCRYTIGVDPCRPADHGWNMESTRQTTHVN